MTLQRSAQTLPWQLREPDWRCGTRASASWWSAVHPAATSLRPCSVAPTLSLSWRLPLRQLAHQLGIQRVGNLCDARILIPTLQLQLQAPNLSVGKQAVVGIVGFEACRDGGNRCQQLTMLGRGLELPGLLPVQLQRDVNCSPTRR